MGPLQHDLDIHEFGPIPVLFQDAPAPPHGIVFAVARWVIQELDGLADMIGEIHHALEKSRAPTTTFRPVVRLDLEQGAGVSLFGGLVLPPSVETVHNEVTRLRGTAKGQMRSLSGILCL